MAGITQRLLHLRRHHHPYPLHHYSSSSSPPSNPPSEPHSQSEPQAKPRPSFSSYFTEVKSTLQQKPNPYPKSASSTDEIRRNLAQFRFRSAAPPPPQSSAGKYTSLQDLYNRNAIQNAENSAASSDSKRPTGRLEFDAIRDSLRQLRSDKTQNASQGRKIDPVSLSRFTESLKPKPDGRNADLVIGGSEGLPLSIFGKEREKGSEDGNVRATRMGFDKKYGVKELGEKLRMLRPDTTKNKGNWFSLQELSERFVKLREIEEKESQERKVAGGSLFHDLRESIVSLALADDEKKGNKTGKFPFFLL